MFYPGIRSDRLLAVSLEIDLRVLHMDGVRFTAEVSNKAGVELLTLDEARTIIDFEVLCTYQDWKDPAIKERLDSVEKYELLVPTTIPLGMIRNLPNG